MEDAHGARTWIEENGITVEFDGIDGVVVETSEGDQRLRFHWPSVEDDGWAGEEGIPVLEFDVGLVPGVVIGSFLAAFVTGELKFQGFEGPTPMRNAMIGAALMGFGGMLAGGCAIGAGVTGGSIFAGTAWLALFCMWIGGMSMDLVMGGRGQPAAI